MPTVYTVKEIAEMLKVSEMTVYRLVKSGKLDGFKAGGAIRVTEEALRDFFKAASATAPKPERYGGHKIVTKIV